MICKTTPEMKKEIDRIAIQKRGISSLQLMETAAGHVAAAAGSLADLGQDARNLYWFSVVPETTAGTGLPVPGCCWKRVFPPKSGLWANRERI